MSYAAAAAAVIAGAVLWGTTGTAQALAPAAATSVAVATLRTVVGGAALAVVVGLRAGLHARGPGRPVRPGATAASRPRRPPVAAVGLAGLGVAGYNLFFFAGVAAAGVAVGTLVALTSAPVVAGIAEVVLRRRRPVPGWVPATGLALVGTVLLIDPRSDTGISLPGLIAALGAGASYVVVTFATKELLGRGMTPLGAMAAAFAVGGTLLLPFLATVPLGWVTEPRGAVVAVWLALGTTAGGYLLFATGLQGLEPPTVTTLTLAEPLTAAALGIAVLGERLTTAGWIGAALVCAGLAVLVVGRCCGPDRCYRPDGDGAPGAGRRAGARDADGAGGTAGRPGLRRGPR